MDDKKKSLDIVFYTIEYATGTKYTDMVGYVKDRNFMDHRNMACNLLYENGFTTPQLAKIFDMKKERIADCLYYHKKNYNYIPTYVRSGKWAKNVYADKYNEIRVMIGDVALDWDKIKNNK